MKNLCIRQRYFSRSQGHQSSDKPSHPTTRHTTSRERHTSPRTNNSNTDKKLVKNGSLLILIRKGTTELSRSFRSILRREKSPSLIQCMRVCGSPTLMGRVRISMKLWPSHALQQVSWFLMKLEETNENKAKTKSDLLDFVVIIMLILTFFSFGY
jgi:hypothetical protein